MLYFHYFYDLEYRVQKHKIVTINIKILKFIKTQS